MKLTKFGIILNRVTKDKIELIRNWRNDPKISKFMEFQDHITSEMQELWFERINNDNNYFFLIEFEGQEIGMINIKDIDTLQKEGEGGIFIYNEDYLNSDISFRSSLCIMDFIFESLKLKTVLAHIKKDNKRAITYNKLLGFKIANNQANILNQKYELKYDSYIAQKKIILRLF